MREPIGPWEEGFRNRMAWHMGDSGIPFRSEWRQEGDGAVIATAKSERDEPS